MAPSPAAIKLMDKRLSALLVGAAALCFFGCASTETPVATTTTTSTSTSSSTAASSTTSTSATTTTVGPFTIYGNQTFAYPRGVAVDGAGNVFVADTDNHRVQKFDSAGNCLVQWGIPGLEDGEFSSPFGVAVDSAGNVFVADAGNSRIQKFDSSGNYLAQWGSGDRTRGN